MRLFARSYLSSRVTWLSAIGPLGERAACCGGRLRGLTSRPGKYEHSNALAMLTRAPATACRGEGARCMEIARRPPAAQLPTAGFASVRHGGIEMPPPSNGTLTGAGPAFDCPEPPAI